MGSNGDRDRARYMEKRGITKTRQYNTTGQYRKSSNVKISSATRRKLNDLNLFLGLSAEKLYDLYASDPEGFDRFVEEWFQADHTAGTGLERFAIGTENGSKANVFELGVMQTYLVEYGEEFIEVVALAMVDYIE